MTVQMYRKKTVVIEAIQWTGENLDEIQAWVGLRPGPVEGVPGAARGMVGPGMHLWVEANQTWLPLDITEWIIKDENGFYPCKAATFERTYEAVSA